MTNDCGGTMNESSGVDTERRCWQRTRQRMELTKMMKLKKAMWMRQTLV